MPGDGSVVGVPGGGTGAGAVPVTVSERSIRVVPLAVYMIWTVSPAARFWMS